MTYLEPRYKSSLIETGLQPSGMMAPPIIYNLNYSANTQTITPDLIYGNALYRINIIIPNGSVVPNPAIIVEFSDNVLKQLFGNVCIIYFYIQIYLNGGISTPLTTFKLQIKTPYQTQILTPIGDSTYGQYGSYGFPVLIDTSLDVDSSAQYNRIYPVNGFNQTN
ncbi:MAG: hypothetical protein RLZZ418_276 [Pseudomonadota bacterium]|jgi:hypothetical protein